MITWFKEKEKNGYITLFGNTLTLNATYLTNFSGCSKVLLGINYIEQKVYIKPVCKEIYEQKKMDEKMFYNITVRKSYGRITKKEFVEEILNLLMTHFDTPKKYFCEFDYEEQMLVVDLKKEILN